MKKTFVQSSTAIGSFLMAIGASACCIISFTLFSMGVGGAWIGNLTVMSGCRSIFIFVGLGFLAAGYWWVFKRPILSSGEVCIAPFSQRINPNGDHTGKSSNVSCHCVALYIINYDYTDYYRLLYCDSTRFAKSGIYHRL